jgi:sulfite reductase (NADPH) flavoprotein alpha-component
LLEETTVLLPISTWGDGEPPDDGANFFDYVKSLGSSALRNLRFAVFALGDTSYDNFCQCGKDFDRMFEERGATRLLDRADNDVDFEGALANWHDALVAILRDTVTA